MLQQNVISRHCFLAQARIRVGKCLIKYTHLHNGKERDDNVDDVKKRVCLLYGIGKKAVKDVDNTIFVKTKRCPPTHGTLELYILRANYQALRYGFKQTMQ